MNRFAYFFSAGLVCNARRRRPQTSLTQLAFCESISCLL